MALPSVEQSLCQFPASDRIPIATVFAPGTKVLIGEIRDRGGSSQVIASLGVKRGRPVLRAAIRGEHMEAVLDLDPQQSAPLELVKGLEYGPATLIASTPVHVLGASGEQVLVGPGGHHKAPFVVPTEPIEVPLSCEELRLVGDQTEDYWVALMKAAGVEEDSEPLVITKGAVLYDAPGGSKVATVPGKGWPRHGYVLERREGWAKIALIAGSGVIWRAWIQEDAVDVPLPGEAARGSGRLVFLQGDFEPRFQACDVDVDLFLTRGARAWPIGMLYAGSPFEITGAGRRGLVEVDLLETWLDPAEGATLALPPGAEACQVVTIEDSRCLDCPARRAPLNAPRSPARRRPSRNRSSRPPSSPPGSCWRRRRRG